MASTLDEVLDVLSDETFIHVEQLKECAHSGLPDDRKIREEVWLYFLGVTPPSKSMISSDKKKRDSEYAAISKTCDENGRKIAFDVNRLQSRDKFFKDNDVNKRIKNVLTAYIKTHSVEYSSTLAQLIAPLAAVIWDETNLFSAFCRVNEQMAYLEPLNSRCSICLTMFQSYLPELHQHLEEEEISFQSIMEPWLSGMLVAQIPLDSSIQLWDVYLSRGFGIHPYVCISLLSQMKDELEELDEHEIKRYLSNVPITDVDEVLVHADNLIRTSRNIL